MNYALPSRSRTTLALLALASGLAACGERHAPSADSVAIAQLVAREAVPVFTSGRTAALTADARVAGASFDSTYRAEMAPVVTRLRGADTLPPVLLRVDVTSFTLAGDSAEAVVHRRGVYRADTARFSSSDTRYRLSWAKGAGWTVTQTEPFNFQGEGQPPTRARDVWWPEASGAKPDSGKQP